MHIMIVAAFYPPHHGGYELYAQKIATGLVRKGAQVTVVTCNTDHHPFQEEQDGVMVLRLPCWNLLGGTYPVPKPNLLLWRVFVFARQQKVTVVNGHTRFFVTTFLAWVISRWIKRPYVHLEHGTQPVMLNRFWPRSISRFYDWTLGRLVVRGARVVVASSHKAGIFMRRFGVKTYSLAYNGVDTSFFQTPHTWKSRGRQLLFVGRLIAAKGVDDLLTAFERVQPVFTDAKLLIIGDGNYAEQLQQRASGNASVTFERHVSQDQLRAYYQQARIFVNPSYSEGLPTSVLEALACGCEAIATNVGGTSEIAENISPSKRLVLYPAGKTDILENCIRVIFRSSETPVNNSISMQVFSWNKTVQTLFKLFSEVTV